MGAKKKSVIPAVLFVAAALACIVYWLFFRPPSGFEELEGYSSTDATESAEETDAQEYPTDAQELLAQRGERAFYDERGGFVFTIPDGMTAQDKENYYILYNPGTPDGCLAVTTRSDAAVSDAMEAYDALLGQKNHIEYPLGAGGNVSETKLYDTNYDLHTETVGEHEAVAENPAVFLSGGRELETRSYNFEAGGKPVCVTAAALKETGQIGDFDQKARETAESLAAVSYTGKKFPNPLMDPDFQMTDISFGGYAFEAPATWDVFQTDDGMMAIRPPAASGDPMQGSAIILCLDDSLQSADLGDPAKTFETGGEGYANMLGQNPESDNEYTIEYAVFDSLGTSQLPNISLGCYDYRIAVKPSSVSNFSSMPTRAYTVRQYQGATAGNKTLNITLWGEENKSKNGIQALGERIVETLR